MEKYENLFVSYIASSIFLHFEHSYMEKAINKKKKKKKKTHWFAQDSTSIAKSK